MVSLVIEAAHRAGRKIGLCSQAPSDYPEFAQFLVEKRISSISLNPDTVLQTTHTILEAEASLPAPTATRSRPTAGTAIPTNIASPNVVGALSEAGAD